MTRKEKDIKVYNTIEEVEKDFFPDFYKERLKEEDKKSEATGSITELVKNARNNKK